jgi:phytoene dehydrogenase-like protein
MSAAPDKRSYDAIVIGAGHNGLVAAAYLARAGQRVLVLERRAVLGGAAGTEPLFPGYRVDTGASDAGAFLPGIAADLGLENYGLEFLEGAATVFAPQPDGRALTLWRDPARTQAEIARFSPADADRFSAFARQAARLAAVLDATRSLTPPSLPHYRYGELLPWLRVALQLRRMGEREMMDFVRILPMPAAEFLDEWFESPALKGALAGGSVTGSLQGPRGSGTALMLLFQALGARPGELRAGRFVRGGMGSLAEALAAAAREHGAEICTGLGASGILVEDGAASGVILDTGESVLARAVLSNASPKHTFFDLVGAPHLEVRFVRELKHVKYRGCLARVILGLSALPRFQGGANPADGYAGQLSGHILISPNLDYLERAYDDAKYGEISTYPYLDAAIPTILDPTLAPPGEHLMVINLQYAPYHLREGDWDSQRAALEDRAIATLAAYAPGLQDLILHSQALTPLDLERSLGLPEGDIYHGQMGLDQLLFMRPVPGYGRYRTPVDNLFLCGAGAHPGGGVTGAPGYNAAREALKALRA